MLCHHTFKAGRLGQVECGVIPADAVLGVGSTGLQHLMESCNSIALFELCDLCSDFVHNPADIIALVAGRQIWHPFWDLPVG